MHEAALAVSSGGLTIIKDAAPVTSLFRPALRDVLHWLPVPQRTEFKIAVLVFDCVRGTGPAYFKDVCVPVSDIAARSSLRSAERGDLFVPRTRTMKLSRRSFTVAAPVVWNSLPAHDHH